MKTKSFPLVTVAAWVVMLLVSTLPTILFKEITGNVPDWLFWAKIGLLGLAFLLSLFVNFLKPLRWYFLVVLALFMAEWGADLFSKTALWKSWFPSSTLFKNQMLSIQLIRLLASTVMVVVMLLIKRKFSAFFLVKGDTAAEAAPIPLILDKPVSWKKFGWILSLCISGGTLVFLLLAGRPSLAVLGKALPLLPFVLLFAAMNAFSEEMSYRSTLLSTLPGAVGNAHALLISALFFGIGHFYGVPYGIIGVIMSSALGWLLGKSMLETKGFWWAWWIHFLQDVLIFSFMAIGSVTPGG